MGFEKFVTHTGNGFISGVGDNDIKGGVWVGKGILVGAPVGSPTANSVGAPAGWDNSRTMQPETDNIMPIKKNKAFMRFIFSFPGKKEHLQIKVYHDVYFFFHQNSRKSPPQKANIPKDFENLQG